MDGAQGSARAADRRTWVKCHHGGKVFAFINTHDMSQGNIVRKRYRYQRVLTYHHRGILVAPKFLIASNPLPRLFCRGAGINHNSFSSLSPKCFPQSLLHTQYGFLLLYHFIMDPIDPIDDSRVSHCYANVNGTNYRMVPPCTTR